MTWLAEAQLPEWLKTLSGLGVLPMMLGLLYAFWRGWIRAGREAERDEAAHAREIAQLKAAHADVIAIKDAKAEQDLRHVSNLTGQLAEQWGKRETDLTARLAKLESEKNQWMQMAMAATHQTSRVTTVAEKVAEKIGDGKIAP